MKNSEVARAFLKGKCASSNNMYSSSNKLFSYSTCIAQYFGQEIIGNATKYSSTSSRHLSYIAGNVTIWTKKHVPRGTSSLIEYIYEN